MSEVKRWKPAQCAVFASGDMEFVEASEHDRIVAQKDAVISKLREQRNEAVHDSFYEAGYGPTPGAVQKIEKLDAELAALEGKSDV